MTDYRMLAVYYLKHNKKRSINTIIGVVIAVLVLFVLLNTMLDYFLNQRVAVRKEADYDLVLYTETQSQIDAVISREDVKSAYVGEAYNYETETLCKNALYVNLDNPYKMSKTLQSLEQEYNVAGSLNSELAMYYFNDGEDNLIFIAVMFVIWIAYIFAIFGVGIIRNSIQLCLLEQLKDYGILRCIGATKGQLRTVIYIMGAILEIIGVAVGVVLGYPVSAAVGLVIHNPASFHILPAAVILVVFLGDLYFVMQENCRFINRMTPISAVRGEFRIKKERIKARGKGIMGRFFGVEGEYAHKSLMRNPGRYFKSVFAIGIGVAAVIVMMSYTGIINKMLKDAIKHDGKYQLYYYDVISPGMESDAEAVMASLPPMEALEKIAAERTITEAKRIYISELSAVSPEAVVGRITEEYYKETAIGNAGKNLYDNIKDGKDDKHESFAAAVNLIGYDEEDYQDLEDRLIDGTLDISENGLVLVGASEAVVRTEDDTLVEAFTYGHYTVTDYKVGETIDIVDPQKFMTLVKERETAALKEEKEGKDPYAKYNGYSISEFTRKELIEAGEYKTYTIEGIVDLESVGYGYGFLKAIVPLENYFAITGMGENEISGIQFHMEGTEISSSGLELLNELSYTTDCVSSMYGEILYVCIEFRKVIRYVALAVLFVVTLSGVNIVNTTASNLHLRRKEFAQLRVIGLSKKRLMYTVMLEGIATTIGANIFGVAVGIGISYYLHLILRLLYPIDFAIPWISILVGAIASGLLLCGAVYVPLKGLPMDMASDLTTDGD